MDAYDVFYVVLAIAAGMYIVNSVRCWICSSKNEKEFNRREEERRIRREAKFEAEFESLKREVQRNNGNGWIE